MRFSLQAALLLLCAMTRIDAQTWEDTYDAWTADLQPGWVIETTVMGGQKCHCKVPGNMTTTTMPTTTTSTTTPTTTSTTTTSTTTTTTPTTTTTTTPTTTTTTTPTTTTTTTPTTTTTTPTTTTTTTTTPTTTTTTTPTTTTTTTPAAIDCDAEIIVTPGSYVEWTSPNYPNNYPDDIMCTVTITIDASMPMGMALIDGIDGEIHDGTGNCQTSPDRIVFTKAGGSDESWCGIIDGGNHDALSSMNESPKSMTFTFISSSADGGVTAQGISLSITGMSLFG